MTPTFALWLGFVVGLMVGACVGLLVFALCRTAALADGAITERNLP